MRSTHALIALALIGTVLLPSAAAHVPLPLDHAMCNDPMVPCAVQAVSSLVVDVSYAVGHTACHVFGPGPC